MAEDISLYVDQRLNRDITSYIDHRLAHFGINVSDHDGEHPIALIVGETLKSKAQGSFLYARLMIDDLLDRVRKGVSPIARSDLKQILDSLPTGLDELYAGMLAEHGRRTNTPWALQLSILQWVTHSERPLRLLELSTIVSHQTKATQIGQDAKALIRRSCGPLLEILPSDIVGPIHHSLTEYLTATISDSPILYGPSAHRMMAEQCLGYLVELFEKTDGRFTSFGQAKLEIPFFEYSTTHWCSHVRQCDRLEGPILEFLDRLCLQELARDSKQALWAFWQNGHFPSERPTNLMHTMAALGLHHYAEHLAVSGHDVEAVDIYGRTPIFYAAQYGWPEVVKSLVRAGANADADDRNGLKPMHVAAQCGQSHVVRALLQAGINPSTPKTKEDEPGGCLTRVKYTIGDTPLRYACEKRDQQTCMEFIPYLDSKALTAALRYASGLDNTGFALAVVKQNGFDALATMGSGIAPLYQASAHANIALMEALLMKGADANCVSNPRDLFEHVEAQDSLPIHGFAQAQCSHLSELEIQRGLALLMQAGNDVNARDGQGRSPLSLALESATMVRALIKLGANTSSDWPHGITPLHTIATQRLYNNNPAGSDMALMQWIENGVDIDARQHRDGQTALSICVQGRDPCRAINLLLEHGADPNIRDNTGWTALHHCARSTLPDKQERLWDFLRAGADVHARTDDGDSMLHFLVLGEYYPSILEYCISKGFDLESSNKSGKTVLLNFCTRNDGGIKFWLPSLLRCGSRLDARDNDGATAVNIFWSHYLVDCQLPDKLMTVSGDRRDHLAAESADWSSIGDFDSLIAAGADPMAIDSMGNNAWHCILSVHSRKSRGDAFSKLKDLAVDPYQTNLSGQSSALLTVANGDVREFELFRTYFPGIAINCADASGKTAIHLAAAQNEALVKRVYALGADLKARTENGWTALHFAAQARQPNVLLLLLTLIQPQDDFANAKDSQGRTALDIAGRTGMAESVDLLTNAIANLHDDDLVRALDSCAEFPTEHRLWIDEPDSTKSGITLVQEKDEDVARTLGAKAVRGELYSHSRLNVSLRRCVRMIFGRLRMPYEPVGKVVVSGHSNSHQIRLALATNASISASANTSAECIAARAPLSCLRQLIDKAVTFDCKPMIRELISVMQSLPREMAVNIFQELTVSQRLKLESTRERGEQLLQRLREGESQHLDLLNLRQGGEQGDLHLLENVYSVEDQLWTPASNWSHAPVPVLALVDHGADDVLLRLSSRIVFQDAPHSLQDRHLAEVFARTFSSLDRAVRPSSAWDAVLLHVCHRALPSLPLIKVLSERFPVSDHGKLLAVHRLALGNHLWNIGAFEYLLSHGVQVNSRDALGRTALHAACAETSGRAAYGEEAVRRLLELGADPNAIDNEGASCLTTDTGKLDLLLAHGADLDTGRPTLLNKAIKALNVPLVKFLIEKGADVNARVPDDAPERRDPRDNLRPDIDIIDAVLAGRDVDLDHDLADSYPLHAAACRVDLMDHQALHHCQIIEMLLAGDANPNLITKGGDPISHAAAKCLGHQRNHIDLILGHRSVDLQLRDSQGDSLLLTAAKQLMNLWCDRSAVLIELIQRGADVRSTNNNGQNILHLLTNMQGTYNGPKLLDPDKHHKLLVMCQENGLINAADTKGNTPLGQCLEAGAWKHVEALLKLGADLAFRDSDGRTAFHQLAQAMFYADWIGAHSKLRDEWQSRANVDVPSHDTLSQQEQAWVSTEARAMEDAEISRLTSLLQSHSIDINSHDNSGETPLFYYLRSCPTTQAHNPPLVDDDQLAEKFLHRLNLLLAAGADLYVVSNSKQTALHALASCRRVSSKLWSFKHRGYGKKHDEPLRMAWQTLVAAGLDPYAEDELQRTPIDVAAASGNAVVLEMY